MANKDNQSKQYRIYIKEFKSWVDVNKEFYTNYYRETRLSQVSEGTRPLCLPCKQALLM